MKQLISILFLFLISMHVMLKMGVLISWKINQDYIAKTLCIQKNVKGNCCQGKCHLKKELNKLDGETSKEDNSSEQKLKLQSIDAFVLSSAQVFYFKHELISPSKIFFTKDNNYHFHFIQNTIKPPIVII